MRKLLLSFLLAITLFSFFQTSTKAVDPADCEKDTIAPDKASDCIDYLSKKASELGAKKNTLSSQVSEFNSQIKLTQAKITGAELTIAKLEKEINALGFKIDYVNESVGKLESLLKQRIVATYEQSYVSNLELLATSQDFSDLILRVQYLKQVQENDKRILLNLQQSKANFGSQKDEREQKQVAIEENKKKLESLKVSLGQQKTEKQALLDVTSNDEARYQRLLSEAQAETAVSFGGGAETYIRDVNAGDSIGTIAAHNLSPGCSSGSHLHFEVHKNGSLQDPNSYLKPFSFSYSYSSGEYSYYGTISPHGDLPTPLNEPIAINQGFGTGHGYAKFYGSSGHTGIDMEASNATVKAVKSGKLYRGSYSCGGTYSGTLFYARIKHDDGLETLYLHMLPG